MYRFGEFELDVAAFALRRAGRTVRLERQPLELLIMLVERRHQLVPRADIVGKLWGADVFVDVDTGVNTAIRKVRQALGDSPEAAAYIVTVAGKGYRFAGAVEDTAAAGPDDSAARVTIAVLPFENLSADRDREYLADGLTEEAIAVLGNVDPDRIAVIGRTSVLAYRRTTKTLGEIGRELGAGYLIESSIRGEGARLRITSRLIRAADQAQVWSASFDSEPGSLLEFQRELCGALAEQIRVKLSPERLSVLERRHTRDAAAYHLYLQGRYFWNQLTPETTRRAVECFSRATARDGDYALAWSGIADAHAASPITGDTPPLVVGPIGLDAARRAIAADPELAAAHTSIGSVHFFLDWKWPQAEAAYRRAVALDPGYALAHRMLGILLSHMGRPDEALAVIRRARELDPLYAMHHALSAQIAFAARDNGAAAHFARQSIAIDPTFWIGYLQLAQALEQMGDTAGAFDALERAHRLGGNSKAVALRGYLLATRGREQDARDLLGTLESIALERFVPPCGIALVHLGLGDHDAVFACLERALAVRDVHLIFLPVDPKWDALRGDERFDSVLQRCGFAV